jgi:histidyl-tRNA synthetase
MVTQKGKGMARLSAIRGFHDSTGDILGRIEQVEAVARKTLEVACYEPIRLPIVEYSEVFLRSVGPSSDIVQKEMYTFEDASGRSLTLRPEGTAGFIRAYLEHGLYKERPVCRYCYSGPMFRHERPQKGRLRQFHQVGAEAMGVSDPCLDAELITLADRTLRGLGLGVFEVHVNSIGCETCREPFKQELVAFLQKSSTMLCEDCRQRSVLNPLRVFDCKVCKESLEKAPVMLEHLCQECAEHFQAVKACLGAFGVDVRINPRIVRGLDYYNRTTFEIYPEEGGAQSVLVAGGRYDGLVETMGGPPTAGIGFALGVERVAERLQQKEKKADLWVEKPSLAVLALGEQEKPALCRVLTKLWDAGTSAMPVWGPQGLKAKLRFVDKRGFRYALFPSDTGRMVLKDMQAGFQYEGPSAEAGWIMARIHALGTEG